MQSLWGSRAVLAWEVFGRCCVVSCELGSNYARRSWASCVRGSAAGWSSSGPGGPLSLLCMASHPAAAGPRLVRTAGRFPGERQRAEPLEAEPRKRTLCHCLHFLAGQASYECSSQPEWEEAAELRASGVGARGPQLGRECT